MFSRLPRSNCRPQRGPERSHRHGPRCQAGSTRKIPNSHPLAVELDQLFDDLRGWAGLLLEEDRQLGVSPFGSMPSVAGRVPPNLWPGTANVQEVIQVVGQHLDRLTQHVRTAARLNKRTKLRVESWPKWSEACSPIGEGSANSQRPHSHKNPRLVDVFGVPFTMSVVGVPGIGRRHRFDESGIRSPPDSGCWINVVQGEP